MTSKKQIVSIGTLLILFTTLLSTCRLPEELAVARSLPGPLPASYEQMFTQVDTIVRSWYKKVYLNHAEWSVECADIAGLPLEKTNFVYLARVRQFISKRTYMARVHYNFATEETRFSAGDVTKADPPFLNTNVALLDSYSAALEKSLADGGHDFIQTYPNCELLVWLQGETYSFTFRENGNKGKTLNIKFDLADLRE